MLLESQAEKILANSKHKMNIFVVDKFEILLPLESDHFAENWLVLKRILWKVDKLIVPDGKHVCRTVPGTSVTPICIISAGRFRRSFKLSLQA